MADSSVCVSVCSESFTDWHCSENFGQALVEDFGEILHNLLLKYRN